MSGSTRSDGAPRGLRLTGAVATRVRGLRSHVALNPAALREAVREREGGHAVDPRHEPHLAAAVAWLVRAQDATPDDGLARGFSLSWNPEFGRRGWQPSYPETTGYIIPTLYEAGRRFERPGLAARAERAARWEIAIQLPSGAVRGGVIGAPPSPAVFNTGQVILGWVAALEETGDAAFAQAVHRAGRYLVATLGADGRWRHGNSRFSDARTTQYNARTAWALAEAGVRLDEPPFTAAAATGLWAVANAQRLNGWLPDCCLTNAGAPLLHTVAYAIRGLVEGGRVLADDGLIRRGALAAAALAETVRDDGWMPGRYAPDWSAATEWSCLTGNAQMANVWLRLHAITGEAKWLEPVPRVLRFLKATQNRVTRHAGLKGGIKGSAPLGAEYGRYQILNWATKFFADALLRHEHVSGQRGPAPGSSYVLA